MFSPCRPFPDPVVDPAAEARLWERFLEQAELEEEEARLRGDALDYPRPLSEDDLRWLLESGGVGGAEEEKEAQQQLRFPELTLKQRKFAVNPAFRSYKDASFRKEEGVAGDDDKGKEGRGTEEKKSKFSKQSLVASLGGVICSMAFVTWVRL